MKIIIINVSGHCFTKAPLLVMGALHQGLFFPIGQIWTRLSTIYPFFDRLDCRTESPRKSDRLLFLNMSSWSSKDMVRAGCLHSIDTTHDAQQRAAEAIQKLQRAGKTRGPSDDQGKTVFDRLMFFNIQQSLFRYPTLGRTEATVPDLHPKVQGSARQCLQVPYYFRKNAADRPKKVSGTIRTKAILGEMGA